MDSAGGGPERLHWHGFSDRYKAAAAEFAAYRRQLEHWDPVLDSETSTSQQSHEPGFTPSPLELALLDRIHGRRWYAPRRLLPASSRAEAFASARRMINLAQGIRALPRLQASRPPVKGCITAAVLIFEAHDITNLDGRLVRLASARTLVEIRAMEDPQASRAALERLSSDARELLVSVSRVWPGESLQRIAQRSHQLLSAVFEVHSRGRGQPPDYPGRCYIASVAEIAEMCLQPRPPLDADLSKWKPPFHPSASWNSLFRKVLSLAEEATRSLDQRRSELLKAGNNSDISPKVRQALTDWRAGKLPAGLALANKNALNQLLLR